MADQKDKYSKVEREILEILDDMDTKSQKAPPSNIVEFRRPAKRRVPRITMPDLIELRYALSPAKLLLVILAAIVGAVFLQDVPFVSPILVVIAIVAFVGVFFARSRPSVGGSVSKSPGVKRWRGRDIDLSKRK
ncbi:MAG: hypothetical protein R3A46_19980 [Thermomicrobiales bacterium]